MAIYAPESVLRCPSLRCKSLGPFKIQITTFVSVFDSGTEPISGDTEWDNDAYCECEDCGRSGTVRDFQIAYQEVRKVQRTKLERLPTLMGRLETEEGARALEKRFKNG